MTETPYIQLNVFLKLQNLASTGGEAKTLIRSEKVKVNGEIDTRNKKKLVAGDTVEVAGEKFIVKATEIRQ